MNNMDDKTIAEIPDHWSKYRKDIHDARVKSESSPYARIMTVNMNGKAVGKGTTSDRKGLLTVGISENFFPSLTFGQEIPGKFKEEVVDKWGTGGNEFVFNGKEAAVIWSNDDFGDYKKLSTTHTSITSLRDKLLKKSDDVSDVLNRIAMVKLTKKVEGASCPSSFLAVSWHGPHKNTLDKKQKVFEGLCDLLEEICKKENISSYLIGGDFNIDTLEDLTVRENMAVEGYELSDRANQSKPAWIPYKDNFLWSSCNRDIQVSGVRIFNFVGSEDKGSDISKTGHQELDQEKTTNNTSEVLLDHDPIVGILSFLPEKP